MKIAQFEHTEMPDNTLQPKSPLRGAAAELGPSATGRTSIEPNHAPRAPGKWPMPFVVAFRCAVAVVPLVGIAVLLNWRDLSQMVRTVVASVQELQAVRSTVARHCGTSEVSVTTNWRSGTHGPILSIKVVNSPRVSSLSPLAVKSEALQIAALARSVLSDKNRYQHFQVILSKKFGAGVSVSLDQGFAFQASELPAPIEPHSH
jgi:hypothetical protein